MHLFIHGFRIVEAVMINFTLKQSTTFHVFLSRTNGGQLFFLVLTEKFFSSDL